MGYTKKGTTKKASGSGVELGVRSRVDVAGTDTPGQDMDISRPGDPGGGWPVYVASWAEYAPRGCGLCRTCMCLPRVHHSQVYIYICM